jgi:hypothetical protein
VCAGDPIAAGAVWELIAGLVAQSLVVAEDQGPDTRYRLLETIRQYGEERLDGYAETAALRRRHAHYYAGVAAVLFERFFGPDQVESATRLAAEQENLLTAMSWAVEANHVDLAFRLLCNIPFASAQLGFGFQLPAEPTLALPGAPEHPDYPVALAIAASKAAFRGDLQSAEQRCEQAIAAERRLGTHPDGLVDLIVANVGGVIAMSVGSWHAAAVSYERAAEIVRSVGPVRGPMPLLSAAQCHALAGDTDAAVPLATEGLALARQVGVPSLIAMALSALAIALADRDPKRARALLGESLEAGARHLENTGQLTQATLVAARLRDRRLTLELASRAAPRLHWNGDRPQLAGILNVVAWAVAEAEPDSAAVLLGAARRLALAAITAREPSTGGPSGDASGSSVTGGAVGLIGELRRETIHRLAERLGEQRMHDLRAEGEAMDTDRAVAHALTLTDRAPRHF